MEEEKKTCRICKAEQSISEYHVDKYKVNGVVKYRHRSECRTCRNKLVRERHLKNGTHKKRYQNLSEEERKAYIKYKSEMNQIRFKTNPKALAKKKLYDKTDRGIWARYNGDCNRRNRLLRGIRVEITFEQFSELINKPCTYCGVENCRGIDRIDSSLSYTIENSTPSCKTCNEMKNDRSIEECLNHIKIIYGKIKPN